MLDTNKIVLGDRYQIQQNLSQKAGRQTLLALDLATQERVIIKILQFDSLFKWDDLKLFEREAKTLKNLDRSAIPQYLNYFEIDDKQMRGFALVQTYIDAPSLEDTVRQGRKFTEAELIELAQKLLKILDYLHSLNPSIIHRDIKPSNILLTNRTGNSVGDLYLVDFGSVQTAASRGNGTITIVGSYGYIPLEQFGGHTTAASDLYSLGMTLIYLITGVHPAELPQNNGKVQFDRSQISDGLQRWLTKMTEPYLDRRFDSAKSALNGLINKKKSADCLDIKPHDTKIKLYRDRHKLEILFERKIPNYKSLKENFAWVCLGWLIAGFIFLLQFHPAVWIFYLLTIEWLWNIFGNRSLPNSPVAHSEIVSTDKHKSFKCSNYPDKRQRAKKNGTIQTIEIELT